MKINKVAFGNAEEAFVEDRLCSGFNIIFSDDNNKGKTIVMQSALYAIGNEPIFPFPFDYKEYYHYVEIELDDKKIINVCRKGESFIVKTEKGINILDSVSELKRFLTRSGLVFPNIKKDDSVRIVDPELLYQVFFVGQDKKDSANIFNPGYYKKEDFWNLVYALAGVDNSSIDDIEKDEIKNKIALLKDEKKVLLEQNKILKKSTPSLELISQKYGNDAFEAKVKKVESIRNNIIDIKKRQNRALQRKTINEKTLSEIRALNRTPSTGDLYCLDCDSKRIGYSSGDKSYSFDISDTEMRRNILEAIEDKISAYQEEIDACTLQINTLQRQLQELFKDEEVELESVLLYKNEIIEAKDADTRIVQIDQEIKKLNANQKVEKKKTIDYSEKKEEIKRSIIETMNQFYKSIDSTGSLVFDDLFSKRSSVYSGCEATEFYLSKLYALAKVLGHKYPIMMDYFRDGELSTEKEEIVIREFSKLSNQIIFTATLKEQELGKYSKYSQINCIDYSINTASHIMKASFVIKLRKMLSPLMIKI
ncbi:MAG: hypothetical protein J5625_00550 [Lachnospiraceae bacterium]|nr:hypothetical protein [Lachnospiraceae bacterium]